MANFLLVVIALGLVLTTFAGGVFLGFILKVPSRVERIRKMRDEMIREIDETVEYYVGLQERLTGKQGPDQP